MQRRILALLALILPATILLSSSAAAQSVSDTIDLYFADWHTSSPQTIRGALQVRDIFTRGDAKAPRQKEIGRAHV